MSERYVPAAKVLQHLKKVRLVLLVGPSGSGKSTIIDRLVARRGEYHFVRTDMSRVPRPGEVDGIDCHFRTRDYMEQRIQDRSYVQLAPNAFGDYYATAAEAYAADKISILPAIADSIADFQALPFKSIVIIAVLPPSYEEWMQRLGTHQFMPERLTKRLQEAGRSLEYSLDHAQHFVINDSIDRAVTVVDGIAHGEAGDDPEKARKSTESILDQLEATYPTTLAR